MQDPIKPAGLGTDVKRGPAAADSAGTIEKSSFGTAADGTPVELYTLRNPPGMEARIITFGGTLVSLKTPDRHGNIADIVLGYEDLQGYQKGTSFYGGLIGRYGNRIARGKFSLGGREYTLPINNPPNTLHGGLRGFHKALWRATPAMTPLGPSLQLEYLSPDGEEGFPGNLAVTALYTLTVENELKLDFTAATDQDTICNLTGHSYFNLRGSGDILGELLQLNAEKFTPVDATLIPTGELRPVERTPFDFRQPTAIGLRIGQSDEQLQFGAGYDHNFVINKPGGELGLAARVVNPASGRVLELFTTAPGMQFYSGNYINGASRGKNGWVYQKREGFCLEAQNFPDSPNHPEFPSVTLRAGETYRHSIVYRFSAGKN